MPTFVEFHFEPGLHLVHDSSEVHAFVEVWAHLDPIWLRSCGCDQFEPLQISVAVVRDLCLLIVHARGQALFVYLEGLEVKEFRVVFLQLTFERLDQGAQVLERSVVHEILRRKVAQLKQQLGEERVLELLQVPLK